jgi:hypothetical protein
MAAFRNTRGIGWVGGCLIVVVLFALLAGGGGYFAFRKAMSRGAEELTKQLKDHPVILQHIGSIREVQEQLTRGPEYLTTEQIKSGWWIWAIDGTKGSGLLKVRLVEDKATGMVFKLVEGDLLVGEQSFPLVEKGEGPGKPERPAVPEKPAESLPQPK